MCRNYDAGECKEPGCAGRITCHDFAGYCVNHDINGRGERWIDEDDLAVRAAVSRMWAEDWNSAEDAVYDAPTDRPKCRAACLGYQHCALWAKWEVLRRGEWLPVCGKHRRAASAWNYESRAL